MEADNCPPPARSEPGAGQADARGQRRVVVTPSSLVVLAGSKEDDAQRYLADNPAVRVRGRS